MDISHLFQDEQKAVSEWHSVWWADMGLPLRWNECGG
jgi:hypothetical protein